MIDLIQLENGAFSLTVDTTIYDDWVIEKVLYWLSSEFIISRKNNLKTHSQTITLEPKSSCNIYSITALKKRLSDDFIDYKNRKTINKETSTIRDLLFAKAFANSDDFVEFSFKD